MARLTAEFGDRIYYNQVMDRGAMRQLIGRLIIYLGSNCTSQILDQLKTLGFRHATQAGISLGVDDLITTPSKTWLIRDAEYQAYTSEEQYRRGSIHAVEKLRHVVETWHTTSEYLKREMTSHFRITDPLNPVHIMSFSGARGNVSQVHQLVGMRGLMANPQGNIIDLPIQSNLREGLSLTEYIISCYGARKGVVDTAVRTADAGYLTRRLVEVVQHVVIRNPDCETNQGIRLHSIRDRKTTRDAGGNSLLSLQERLIGRVLARNVFLGKRCIAIKNQDLAPDLVNSLVNFPKALLSPGSEGGHCEILVRSPLTCKSMPRACQKCYGWDLSCGNLVEIGAAIGIVAGQSIGEPGTQLTLRTFHTGGVFTGGVAEHVRAPFNGIVHFSISSSTHKTKTIQPTRNRHGRPAWTCPEAFSVIIEDRIGKKKVLNVPQYSLLLVKNHQYVQSRQIIAEVRASIAPLKEKIEKNIYSHLQGEVFYNPIGLRASCLKQRHFLHFLCSASRMNLWIEFASIRSYLSPLVEKTSYIWIFSGRLNKFFNATLNLSFFYQTQDYIQRDLPIGIQNHVFNYSKVFLLSIYNRQRSVTFSVSRRDIRLGRKKKFTDYIPLSRISTDKIFSKHTGSIHTISEQNEWILTLSFVDQFSKKMFSSVQTPGTSKVSEKSEEQIIDFQEQLILNYPLSKTTIFLKEPSILAKNYSIAEKDSCIGLLGEFFIFLNELSIVSVRTFISTSQINLFLKKNVFSLLCITHGNTFKGKEKIFFINDSKNIYNIKNWLISVNFLIWCHFSNRILNKNQTLATIFLSNRSLRNEKDLQVKEFKIGQSICPSRDLGEKIFEPFTHSILPESGHLLSLNEGNLLIRLAKLYLIPTGGIAHTFHKQTINEGDTLVTLAYERLKASDIIQGLPKAEQLLEARVGNQVVINLYMRFEILVARIKEQLRNYIGSLTQMDLMLSQISVNRASKALEYSQLETVDQVQKVYLSQGVYISDKHFEVIVRQMSSKIAIVENTDFTAFSPKAVIRTAFPYDVLGVFFPGEILDISKAQKMNRVLYKPLPCKPVLLGITQASLNANSFLSEASFERTITVLSRSALQGRMDWLKGLKENVLLSKMIPAGTGLKQAPVLLSPNGTGTLFSNNEQNIFQKKNVTSLSKSKGQKVQIRKIFSFQKSPQRLSFLYQETSSSNIRRKIQPTVCLCKPFITKRNWLHISLKQLTEQSLNYETKKFCLQELTNNFIPRKKENIFYLKKKTIKTT
uniref:DNA-directed RNA polymerase subunit beta'' n=1 Tax=Staurastrum punctulatum TaxID=102822 RepID=RPOC2_STAPU|nr:RNA polymerase beta'' subunit [Staurastrum punctulatum]Q32RY2.1 RecName: Full=DNA-directed RNA polymerase subunit beta''; AltName: Full=PEP; AltName: Full=Plastid-encoded RNA polymerase subunit beta''; Short=RNA polymerase subunit beta'' [Staurastrum punctulatum]AAX45749.1 beta'' subunit of RNA polymerase [Staurastrum punctulatum]